MTFQIISIEDGFDFRDGTREMTVQIGLGRSVVRVPIDQASAELLVALRTAAMAAMKATMKATRRASREPEEDLVDEDDDEAPVRLGRDDELVDEDL